MCGPNWRLISLLKSEVRKRRATDPKQFKRVGELHLARPQQGAPQADAATDVNVNWVRTVFGDGPSFSLGVSHLSPSVFWSVHTA